MMMGLCGAQDLGAQQQMAQSPLGQRHQPGMTLFPVLSNFACDTDGSIPKVDVLQLEISDFSTSTACARGNGSTVHCNLPVLVLHGCPDDRSQLGLGCHFSDATLYLPKRTV